MAQQRPSLDLLVTQVASQLMAVDSATMVSASREVLRELVDYFQVDGCFLRHHDSRSRTTSLIAEWPVRDGIPDPDPLRVIHFADADSVTAAAEHAREPIFVRPDPANADYQELIDVSSGVQQTSAVGIPLLSGNRTTGVLGLVKFGNRGWPEVEVNALNAIAALFAQLQARAMAEELLRHQAQHDELTSLFNRRFAIEYLQHRLAAEGSDPVSVLHIDIDRLKALNDFLGHAAGDDFIVVLADRLRGLCGAGDMIARVGGDEFMIVPGESSDTSAGELAGRLQKAVNEPVVLGGEMVSRGVTIGVAHGVPGKATVSDLFRQSDRAGRIAKMSGGNDIEFFTDEMRAEAELRDDIELRLRRAISADELVLHYQPEIDLRDGRVVAAEALVRWNHPTRGMLLPGTFIQIAEETNLAGELGRWVLRTACTQFAEWQQSDIVGREFVLRVNVSPVQLVSLNFVDSVREILRQTGVGGHSLCFEITEHAVVQDLDRTQITLRDLKQIGVQVAIDDFGTGYSSLSHLKALAVDSLKIDRGFVQRLGEDEDDLAIVRSIIGLAESFNLEVVAEGVETLASADALRRLGCYRCQGFLYSRPLAAEAIRDLLAVGVVDIEHPAIA